MDTSIRAFSFKKSLSIEFEILDLSVVKETPRLFTGPSRAGFYQLLWLTAGEAVFDLDFRKIKIRSGELLIISLNQVYGFDTKSEYKGKMILFTDSFFNRTELDSRFLHTSEILNPLNLNQTIPLKHSFVNQIVGLLEEELSLPADAFQSHIAQSFLRVLLLEMERKITNCSSPMFNRNNLTIGRRFCDEVERLFKTTRQVEHYVRLMGVGEKLLSKEVKLLTGKTPKGYIDLRIILEAKRLLAFGVSTVKEISVELGFEEATNFNKFFRKHTGITPVTFRLKNLNS